MSTTSSIPLKSSREKAFPKLDLPLQIQNADLALSKSKIAEDQFFKALFKCHSGGGEKGIHKHVNVNKKLLPRERIRQIIDEDADFFDICPTAGLGLDYGDVPGGGTITGIGTIRGHLVMIIASDGSLKGGKNYFLGYIYKIILTFILCLGTSYPITVTKSLRAQVLMIEKETFTV